MSPSPSPTPLPAPSALQIIVNAAEPLSNSVQLSLSGASAGPVTWYVDLQLLGSGGSVAGAPITWDTTRYPDGSRLIIASIETAPGTYEDARRTVTVANSPTLSVNPPSGTQGTIAVYARASSPHGISSVSATLDGTSIGSLTAPNHCFGNCASGYNYYRFTINAAAAGSGQHTMVITAVDGAGNSRQVTLSVPISNAPVLTVTAPADGTLIHGTLNISGTATTDLPSPVTTTARLGGLLFLTTTASSFSGSLSLAGVAPGAYTLTVQSTDNINAPTQVQRTVVVTSSAALAYTPVFTLPMESAGSVRVGARLLAAEGTKVLYATGNGDIVLRDLNAGAEVSLAGAAAFSANYWQFRGGRIYAAGSDSDCVGYCIYQWSADGTRTNLSTLNPYGWVGDWYPVVRDGYVIWHNDGVNAPGQYTTYNTATGTYAFVAAPAGVNYVGNTEYDFAVIGGVIYFYFWGPTGGVGGPTYDVFLWRSDTQATTRITQNAGWNVRTQTDGVRVAWARDPTGVLPRFSLVTLPVAGGTESTVSSNASQFILRDGVLAWTEGASGTALKASTTGGSTLSIPNSAALFANGEGRVIYGEAGRMYSWDSATTTSTLRLETGPDGLVLVAGGAVLFRVGASVYRVPF